MNVKHLLAEVGLDSKEAAVYLKLLTFGACPVKKISDSVNLNRIRTISVLKNLQQLGLVISFKRNKKDLYQAEDPKKLFDVISQKERGLSSTRRQVAELMPEMRSIYAQTNTKTLTRHFEGKKGSALVLKDIIQTVSGLSDKTYRSYSSSLIRRALGKELTTYVKNRIAHKVKVKIISSFTTGDVLPLAERRLNGSKKDPAVHIMIYGNKMAVFSINPHDNQPQATVIEDVGLVESQRMIFDLFWEKLAEK